MHAIRRLAVGKIRFYIVVIFEIMETLELTVDKDKGLDELQIALAQFEPVNCPLHHAFLPGVYIRQIFMPAITKNSQGEDVETVIVSKIHKTSHPFVVTQGKVAVYNKLDEFLGVIEALYVDVTLPGTRRVLHLIEDCRWLTIHRLPYITGNENGWSEKRKEKLLVRIENDLIEKRDIKLEDSKCRSLQ